MSSYAITSTKYSCAFLALLLGLLPLRAHAGSPVPEPPLPTGAAIQAMGSGLFREAAPTGMVLVVVRGDQTFFDSYGETAPGSHRAPTRDSFLRLCSLTKIFTADVLAKLTAERLVRLNDSLQSYAPAGVRVPVRGRAISLEDLATHTSGLPRELGDAPPDTPHFTFPAYATRWHWLPNQRLRSVPGTSALYSNVAFDFLADALASATHRPYPALLEARTLAPLHMRATTFFPNPAQCNRLLIGARYEGPCTATAETDGSSGLYSTAADMTLWLQYLLNNSGPGTSAQAVYLLPSQLRSQSGLSHAGDPTGIGLGWIHILPLNSPSRLVQKTGGGAGFHTYIVLNHARRTALFLAATDGTADTHLNIFNAANKLLLAVAGLPPLPAPPPRKAAPHTSRRRRRR